MASLAGSNPRLDHDGNSKTETEGPAVEGAAEGWRATWRVGSSHTQRHQQTHPDHIVDDKRGEEGGVDPLELEYSPNQGNGVARHCT